MMPGNDPRQAQEANINAEIQRMSGSTLASLRQEAGLGDKDPTTFTPDDKVKLKYCAEDAYTSPDFLAAADCDPESTIKERKIWITRAKQYGRFL
jgi:hypothetical protein